jgi:hypothetical protein
MRQGGIRLLGQISFVCLQRNAASRNPIVRSRMLLRAIAAFVALPGIVAFALPVTIGISTGLPMRHAALAAAPLGLGIFLLLWCVREFYVAGRGTLAPRGCTSAPGNHWAVSDFSKSYVHWRCYDFGGVVRALGFAHSNHLHCAFCVRVPPSRSFV